jgi:hypothetical protein
MRFARTMVGVAVLSAACLGLEARAGTMFDTQSTATQMISSPLLGPNPVTLTAPGPQHFTIDTALGTAGVTSAFRGSDFPDPLNPGQFLTYDLYNTQTTGTVTTNGSGTYDITYHLLFELKLTSGPLAGLTFETLQNATFAASNIPSIPFPAGTAFFDPNGSPADLVNIYVKYDPTGTFPAGTLVGASFDRLVTVNQVVPEPSSLTSAGLAALLGLCFAWRRRKVSRTQ